MNMTTQTTLDRVARGIAEADGNSQPGCVYRRLAEAATRETVAGVLADLTAECDRRNVVGADGDAIFYLDAIFALAEGDASTPAEAIALAYGLDQ